jgi:hypothetical protein
MKMAADVRVRWLARLFSTEPAERPKAEAAVRELYIAAGLEPPRHLLWFNTPFDACWAVALLIEADRPAWQQMLAKAALVESNRQTIDRIRASLVEQTAQSNWESVVAAAGPAMGERWAKPNQPPERGSKSVQSEIAAARVRLYGDATPPIPRYDEKDNLFRAQSKLWDPQWGVLSSPEWGAPSRLLSVSFFADYTFPMIAADELEAGERMPLPALVAAWTIARSAGPWWAFERAAVLTERPAEIYTNQQGLLHRGDGPAIVYRDGRRGYMWDGVPTPEDWILHPENIPPAKLKQCDPDFRKMVAARLGQDQPAKKAKSSSILKAQLPGDPAARLERLRQHAGGGLPFFERYSNGECEKVWEELVALGPAVREDPYAADALAVAYETMQRVEANVRTVTVRLREMKYEFQGHGDQRAGSGASLDPGRIQELSPQVQDLLMQIQQARGKPTKRSKRQPRDEKVRAHVPPGPLVRKQISRLEKMAGPLPLSLRAFYEIVGEVNWMGHHPRLSPPQGSICPDPLVVFAVGDALAQCEQMEDDERYIPIAPDDLHKAGASGGEAYGISTPELRADGELLYERHGLLFVDYLRLVFRFGGFPGYDGFAAGVPAEIASLREGLLAF